MPPHDMLELLPLLRRRVVVDREVDARAQPGFGHHHGAMLADVDGVATAVELLAGWTRAGADQALTVLMDLLRWGVCKLEEPDEEVSGSAEIPITVSGDTGPTEVPPELPPEDVDLDERTRARIRAGAEMLRDGRMLELLGVTPGVPRADLKRAYYALAKEFHPDRFFGRKLGPYAPLLSAVFEAASQAIKTLLDQRTVGPDTAHGRPQRRRSPRFAFTTPVRMRAESWPRTLLLTTRQIGAGGLFVATDQAAVVGERVAFELVLADNAPLTLQGRIVNTITGGGSRPAGLCIQLAPLGEGDRARYTTLIDAARAAAPGPASPESDSAPPPRLARGSGSQRALAPVIGIDLGTTFVSVSATIDGRVHVLPMPGGARAMPSVVAFPRRGEVVVGAQARERLARDPRHSIASAKRLLGRKADDKDIQGMLGSAGYTTLPGPEGELLLDMWGEPIAIPQICGHLLGAARVAAEQALGVPIGSAVLTVPVSFGADRVALLQRAAKLAHLEVVDVIEEPSAAALANRFRDHGGSLVGIYDFGGGTFDFSVVDTSGGDFRVVTTAGDSWLGGDDLDLAVADALANLFWRANGVDVRNRAVEWQQLLFATERAKRELSTSLEAKVLVPEIARTARGPVDLSARLQRPQVERIWQPFVDRSLATCLQTLAMVGLQPADLSAVYLSGGTTHVPMVQTALARFFGRPPITGVSPDFAVCLGAGVHAAQLEQLRAPTLQAR